MGRADGWERRRGPPMVIYATDRDACRVRPCGGHAGTGDGRRARVPVDASCGMRPDLLRDQVQRDRADGLLPIAVVATAGTTSTGAIDPLPEIADVCAEQGLWMHVDAAYGGPAVLADDLRRLMAGIERADSIAFDPHKWLYIPLVRRVRAGPRRAAGCRNRSRSTRPTSTRMRSTPAPASASAMLGPQYSRGFQALKLWVSLLAHGTRAYGARISPRCRAGPLHRRPGRAATGVRAGRAGRALDLLLPLRATGRGRRRVPVTAERADHDRAPARRPRLHLQRGARWAVRAARLHRQPPDGG